MNILIAYDINTETDAGKARLRKVAKECQNYGIRVQHSLFECCILPADEVKLKAKLNSIIDKDLDNIRIYYLGNNKKCVGLGNITSVNISEDVLIL